MKKNLRERAYRFAIQAVHFVDSLPNDFSTSTIAKQLMRSSTSIGANLVESKGAASRKDFANFIGYSLKSANETLYWLCLLRDAKRITNEAFEPLYNEAKELANILGASMITLKQNVGK